MAHRPQAESLSSDSNWPADAQAERAAYDTRKAAALASGEHQPTGSELVGIDRGLADIHAVRFATDEQVAAVFARHRRP